MPELTDFLNGSLFSRDLKLGADLDDKTLIINVGGGPITIAFTPVKDRNWTTDEIVNAIIAEDISLATVPSKLIYNTPLLGFNKLRLQSASLTIDKDGTANSDLGFSITDDTVATPVAATELKFLVKVANEQDTWVATIYR